MTSILPSHSFQEPHQMRPRSRVTHPHSHYPRVKPSVSIPHASKSTYPWHVLHKDGEDLLSTVPQAAIVLHNAFMLQVLQQLDLTLQSTHLLERDHWSPGHSGPSCAHLGSAYLALVYDSQGSALETSAGEQQTLSNVCSLATMLGSPWDAAFFTQKKANRKE